MISRLAKMRSGREEGFTLIELLVVIIIIGILAAIAIPVFLNQRKRAQDTQTQAGVRSYVTAAESYIAGNPNATVFEPVAGTFTTANPPASHEHKRNTALRHEGARSNHGVTVLGTPANYAICGYNNNGNLTGGSGYWVYRSDTGTSQRGSCPFAAYPDPTTPVTP